jgi:hypothetical protein
MGGSGGTATGGSPTGGSSIGGSAGTTGGSSTGTTGGSAGSAGACSRQATACASPEVRITDVTLGVSVIGNGNEGDTQPIPLAIAAMPSGGSRLAWMSDYNRYGSSTATTAHVAELDCDDQLVGTPSAFEAYDFSDVAADANGGVLMLTRDAEGSGDQHCGDVNNLCVLPSDRPGCYDMYLVRFDNAGTEQWATKLTSSSAENPPYTSGGGSNHSIWWYQHHGRLAYDGTNYASYFCDAITITNNSCDGNVDIHEGDRMQVVGPDGSIVNHPDAFAGGCSHSWNTRIVWDDRTDAFVMVCATDNNNRVARPAPYRTIYPAPDIGSLSVGNLVLSPDGGYWISVSHEGTTRLLHFTEAAPDLDIEVTSADFSHLVPYGANHMIVAWESGSSITAQVRDARDGSAVSSEFTIGVPDHRYQDFRAFPDGSVAFAAQGASQQSVRIARVMPCSD